LRGFRLLLTFAVILSSANAFAELVDGMWMSPIAPSTTYNGTGEIPSQKQISVKPELSEVESFPEKRIKTLESEKADVQKDLNKQQAIIKHMKPGDTRDGMGYDAYQSLISSDKGLIAQKEAAIKAYRIQSKAANADPNAGVEAKLEDYMNSIPTSGISARRGIAAVADKYSKGSVSTNGVAGAPESASSTDAVTPPKNNDNSGNGSTKNGSNGNSGDGSGN
jgi:hypothetical protein